MPRVPIDDDDADLSKLGPDDAPELTPDMMQRARTIFEIPKLTDLAELVRRGGRPALPERYRKRRVSIMLDPDVIEHFKAEGKGWQTRVNAALRKAAGLEPR